MTIEEHPLEPFLPRNAKVLFLGSFPPPMVRWSMDFFYPNWINDFWRIQGLIHFGNKGYFEANGENRFDKERIVAFCREKGIALFDTARVVRRLKDNADDNFLEIVEGTDVLALMERMTECKTIVTTGGKASEELQAYFAKKGFEVKIPKVGECRPLQLPLKGREDIRWWRMPSTSRAYPMRLEKKAEYYTNIINE